MKVAPELQQKVQYILERIGTTLAGTLGIEYLTLEKDLVEASMPVDARTKQPFGILHGGASVALAESVASIGAWLNVDETKHLVVGLEINANHIRPMREGKIISRATPVHRGAKTQVWDIRITSEDGKLVCISRCTLAVIDKPQP